MTDSPEVLQNRLGTFVNLLHERSFFSLSDEDKNTLLAKAHSLSKRLDSAQDVPLTVGLLGGTGVGKSTLMNALAGSQIASTSYRRPHTDQILIYRHEDAQGIPQKYLQVVPWREVTHRSDTIQHILLCDLPDFDSLMGEHRENVLRFLKHLDILIWVTSPEKYADRRFHEFLTQVPKAEQNFYFVLNKADLLFEGTTPEKGYEQLDSVTKQFLGRLREELKTRRIIFYPVAGKEAEEEEDVSPWNQFPSFRQQIFQQLDVKQIAAIKAANVDVEIDGLAASFQKEVSTLTTISNLTEILIADLEGQREKWLEAGEKPVDRWVEGYLEKEFMRFQTDPTCLLGPGYPLAALLSKRGDNARDIAEEESSGPFIPPNPVMSLFRDHHRLVTERMDHLMLRHRLPQSLRMDVKDLLETKRRLENLRLRLSDHVRLLIDTHAPASCGGFKFFQFLIYFILFCFFLFAVGGRPAWLEVVDTPGISSVVRLVLTIVTALFSTKGLAALGSFILLNLFLGFRFYRRYRNRLEKRSRRMVSGLKTGLLKVWEDELDQILEQLRLFRSDLEDQITTVAEATGKSD